MSSILFLLWTEGSSSTSWKTVFVAGLRRLHGCSNSWNSFENRESLRGTCNCNWVRLQGAGSYDYSGSLRGPAVILSHDDLPTEQKTTPDRGRRSKPAGCFQAINIANPRCPVPDGGQKNEKKPVFIMSINMSHIVFCWLFHLHTAV